LTRKYGGTIESALAHLAESEERRENIVSAEQREAELRKEIANLRSGYVAAAEKLSTLRRQKAKAFQKNVEQDLNAVALQKARFEVRIDTPANADDIEKYSTANGFDR